MPLFSRLGPYDTTLLDRAAEPSAPRLFEYWGHAASLIDVSLMPALRFRMDRYRGRAVGGRPRGRRRRSDAGVTDARPASRRRVLRRPGNWRRSRAPRPIGAGTGQRPRSRLSGCSTAGADQRRRPERRFRAALRPHRQGGRRRRPGPGDVAEQARLECGPAVRRPRSGSPTVRCLADYFRLKQGAGKAWRWPPGRAWRVGRGRRRGLDAEGLPVARLPRPCWQRRSDRIRCSAVADQPVRFADLRARPRPGACSTWTTGSRSTCRPRSGVTGTTSTRSCWMRASRPGSTSRRTGSAGYCGSRRRGRNRARGTGRRGVPSAGCRTGADGRLAGAAGVAVAQRGDPGCRAGPGRCVDAVLG